jgi:hypothetical protein
MTEAGEILRSHMTPALERIDLGLQALRGPPGRSPAASAWAPTPSFKHADGAAVRRRPC